MRSIVKILAGLTVLVVVTGCATGKSVKGVEDLADDGKRSSVFFTYDAKLYVGEKYRTVKRTDLDFECPKPGAFLRRVCFELYIDYIGRKAIDDLSLHAFEQAGSRVVKMKYGEYAIDQLQHSVLVDREPYESCYFDKKRKKDICRINFRDVNDKHSADLGQPINIVVKAGAPCYLGHITITMLNDELTAYDLDPDAALSTDKLSDLKPELAGALVASADNRCS